MFSELLGWDMYKVKEFIEYLYLKKKNIIFSSEINNKFCDSFFSSNFNTYDFKNKKLNNINSKKILFLMNIDGLDMYTAIKKSSEIISPEGIVTHIGYRLNKKILSLMHFNIKDREDLLIKLFLVKNGFHLRILNSLF